MAGRLAGRDILSVRGLSREDVEAVLAVAGRMGGVERLDVARGRLATLFFFEPSTRTRLSFEAAMYRLGGHCLSIHDVRLTSLAKGESISDTFRVLDGYGDLLVIRHSDPSAVKLAADVADHPVVNAGSGQDEHPTQSLIDAYTIKRFFGRVDGLTFCMLGDLKYGRAVRSLVLLLSKFDVDVYLVSPPGLELAGDVFSYASERIRVRTASSLEEVIDRVDVLYVTRIQRERFPSPQEFEKYSGSYRITPGSLKGCKERLIVIHPLPRVDELSPEIDATPHAKYFEQARLGVELRMALLTMILGLEEKLPAESPSR